MSHYSRLFPGGYGPALEGELRSCFAGQEGLLYNMLLYQLGGLDEQGVPLPRLSVDCLHPFLCLLSCESLSGDPGPALPAAAAVELMHQYARIHEDVQSGSPNRGRRPTVWWIWGPGQAINAGDGMHAMARLSLMRLQQQGASVARVLRAMGILDQSSLSLCEGQHLDLAFQERLDVGVDAYTRMAEGKSGALVSCSMGLGALAATEDTAVVEAFQQCGTHLGVAWQAAQDIQDLWGSSGDDGPSDNLLNKKKLLPIIHVLEKGEPRIKRELGGIYFKRVLEPGDVRRIVQILDGCSAREFSRELVHGHCQRAMGALSRAPLSERGRETLQRLCQGISGDG
jgi:geranylgeranyl diphosphate synthase type I